MLDDATIAMLRCPETEQPVALAPAELIEQLNAQIEAGTLTRVDGQPQAERLAGGLLREDGRRLYPINQDEIAVMLAEWAIPIGDPA